MCPNCDPNHDSVACRPRKRSKHAKFVQDDRIPEGHNRRSSQQGGQANGNRRGHSGSAKSHKNMGPTNYAGGRKGMGLNSLTYPLHYEDAKPKTDLNSTLHINRTEETASSRTGFEGIVGKSSVLRRVLQMVETVAGGDSTLLLLGDTGTG